MTKQTTNILIAETPAPGVQLLRLNRPEKHNAISTNLLSRIADALVRSDNDETVRVSIITGNEKVFAAGADINKIRQRQSSEGLGDPRPALWNSIRTTRKPVIAAVEGWCLGAGNELAMSTDLIVASQAAKFGQPETNLGLIAGAGGGAILTRLVGKSLAMQMVLTGDPISAEDAKQAGLINEVYPAGDALEHALVLANKIAARAPIALAQAKAVVNQAWETTLAANLAMERQAFSLILSSQDKNIGIDAFLAKSTPKWEGR